MLFSEPKIPQQVRRDALLHRSVVFQCSSASRKFLNTARRRHSARADGVSVLFSEPKIPQVRCYSAAGPHRAFQCSSASRKFLNELFRMKVDGDTHVSVLFSEPKIPQYHRCGQFVVEYRRFQCSSASRKFLNRVGAGGGRCGEGFQCSSASRKFLNRGRNQRHRLHRLRFSALQRAENSSIEQQRRRRIRFVGFSALQRAENSSRRPRLVRRRERSVSVLFSEPKIPQSDPRTCVHPYSRLRRSRFVVPEPSWCVAMTPVY